MGTIKLPNMRFYTYNGVLKAENELGQQISVDVTIHYPIETAVKDDDLETTVSYVDVYETVEKLVTTRQFKLIESLAQSLLVKLLSQFQQVTSIDVSVHKFYIPLPGIYDPFIISVSGTPSDLERWGY